MSLTVQKRGFVLGVTSLFGAEGYGLPSAILLLQHEATEIHGASGFEIKCVPIFQLILDRESSQIGMSKESACRHYKPSSSLVGNEVYVPLLNTMSQISRYFSVDI